MKIKKINKVKYSGKVYDLKISNTPSYNVEGVFVHNSGSSSIITFLNILMNKNNKILLVPIIPFIKESIPATSNATRVLNRVTEFSNNLSVFVVSNDEITKEIKHNSYQDINKAIIEKVDIITELPYLHNPNFMTPFATDEGDHESVAYSGGFINISHDNLDPDEEGKVKRPKFSYGKFNEANNILITKHIPTKYNEEQVNIEGDKLVTSVMKIGGSAKSARMLYGIIRRNIEEPQYTTLATGLSIDKIFNKLKDKATNSAILYSERKKEKVGKKLERSEDKLLDV